MQRSMLTVCLVRTPYHLIDVSTHCTLLFEDIRISGRIGIPLHRSINQCPFLVVSVSSFVSLRYDDTTQSTWTSEAVVGLRYRIATHRTSRLSCTLPPSNLLAPTTVFSDLSIASGALYSLMA